MLRELELPYASDERGIVTFIESNEDVPFEIKRIFYIFDVPKDKTRGGHGHISCEQVIIALCGIFTVKAENGQEFTLDDRTKGLYVPTGVVIKIEEFTKDAVCLVLASRHYDESDYVS
jgi:dTDP-4-dehydrorhamnose 3,5-epimerase-like enzyme